MSPRKGPDFSIDELRADAGDFKLNSQEREDMEKHPNHVGAITVWDAGLTTVENVLVFLDSGRRLAFNMSVSEILELPFGLHVFRSPLKDLRNGANGHCSLEDMWPTDRQRRRQLQGRLAMIAGTGFVVNNDQG
jgi:hypothetical protein